MNVMFWLSYFELNAGAPRNIPWHIGADLPREEAGSIVPSLQEFQVGENSEGTRLHAAAAAWAARHCDEALPRVVDLFIAEERRHAAELARFLALNGHPVARHRLGDVAFRRLRHLPGGLELSLSVLLTAEIIGFVYYGALRNGTSSLLLRAICETFLLDEAAHLVFHIEQLSRMRRSRRRVLMWPTLGLSRLLMGGACVVVWARHRPVLERGGLDFRRFAARCFERLAFATCSAGAPIGRERSGVVFENPAGS